jgi:hypothetical protein
MNGYELSRKWFNWAFDNPEKIKPIHTAIFFFAMEHCNRLGGKDKFGFPSQMTMDAIGVKSYRTYGKALSDLDEWGFIEFIEKSKNQYSANIISISATSKNDKARNKALDKALIRHGSKQSQSTVQSTGESIDSIVKPITSNQETINQVTKKPIVTTSKKTEKVFSEEIDFKEIQNIFNNLENDFPKIKSMPEKRKKIIKARVREYDLETIGLVLNKASQSAFLNGDSPNGWTANFDWIFNQSNFLKILEDNYINKSNQKNGRDYTEVFKESIRRNAGADLKFS